MVRYQNEWSVFFGGENLKNRPDTQQSMVHFVVLNFQVVLCEVNPWVGASPNKDFGQDCPHPQVLTLIWQFDETSAKW